jgi:hypothetical protein
MIADMKQRVLDKLRDFGLTDSEFRAIELLLDPWNALEDQLPEIGQEVFALDSECGASCACIFKGEMNIFESLETGFDFNDGDFVVTHWMPVPQAPACEESGQVPRLPK